MLQVTGDGYKKGTAAAVGGQFSSDELVSECHAVSVSSPHSGLPLCHTSDVLRGRLLVKAGHWDMPGISGEELPSEVRHITRGYVLHMKSVYSRMYGISIQ